MSGVPSVADAVSDKTNSSSLFEDTYLHLKSSRSLSLPSVGLCLICWMRSCHFLPFSHISTNVFEFVSIVFDAFLFHSIKNQISTVLTSMGLCVRLESKF